MNTGIFAKIALRGSVLLLLVCPLSWSTALGQDEGGRVQVPDVEVRDQHGRKLYLYSDLIKDRIVVVNFFFTTCTFVCPSQGRALAQLQERLGGRLGKEVFIVSISKDPRTDTVAKLKRWSKEFKVGPGWTLVTGEEAVMEKVLWQLVGERPGPSQHFPLLYVGNDRTGEWKSVGGLSAPERVIDIIEQIKRTSGPGT